MDTTREVWEVVGKRDPGSENKVREAWGVCHEQLSLVEM